MDQRPAVVVEAGSAADVAQAVRYARARGIRIAPQGTGHGAGPREPLDGAEPWPGVRHQMYGPGEIIRQADAAGCRFPYRNRYGAIQSGG